MASLFLVTCGVPAQRRNPAPAPPEFYQFVDPSKVPAITDPKFVPAKDALMMPTEPVIGIVLGSEARAYSVWQLERHFVVNDRIAGRAIAVTWCPFSHTGVVYSRTVGGKELTFEADGRLLRDALVLRDRETGRSWTVVDGMAVDGSGHLDALPSLLTNWKEWAKEQPSTVVLDKAGDAIPGSQYADYDEDPRRTGLGHTPMREPRFGPKTLVVGIVSGRERVAIPLEELKRELVKTVIVDQQVMAAIYDPTSDTARVVRAEARTQKVSLHRGTLQDLFGRAMDPHMIDEETGSNWDLTGRAISGKMEGQKLLLVPYRVQYWYAWQAYFPKSRVE